MAVSITNNPDFMTKEEFAAELKGKQNVFIMSTSALDKVREYGELFSSLEIDGYFTGSGAFGINASKTPEMTGRYTGNLSEKEKKQLYDLTGNDKLIRGSLSKSIPDSGSLNIIGMTEDSGGLIFPADVSKTSAFINEVKKRIRKELREEDGWLIDTLKPDEFPGANLRPVQEHLPGGIEGMMNIIYDVADDMGINGLRYQNASQISFQSPSLYQKGEKAVFSMYVTSGGRLLTREECAEAKQQIDALTFDSVQVPDGQKHPAKSLYYLKKEGLFTDTRNAPHVSQYKVEAVSYLSSLTGTRHLNGDGKSREPHIGYLTPETPTPEKDPLNGFDAVVLRAAAVGKEHKDLQTDENLSLALKFVVHAIISPQQKYIILDNRPNSTYGDKRPFDDIITLFRNASISEHRAFGEMPFLVANSDKEMEDHLALVKRVTQRLPKIHPAPVSQPKSRKIEAVPNDGVFTVFIAGGHGNNSKQDLSDGFNLGYMCAEKGYRIVTGAGSVEGSMGSIHTGFIQYHLDQVAAGKSKLPSGLRKKLDNPEYKDSSGKINAEALITNDPKLLNEIADKGGIPRDMFYGYSMKSLLKLESVTGEAPAGITYFETGGIAERIHYMQKAGTKVIMPGSAGTDEEFSAAMEQHLNAKKTANDFSPFSDGTPKDAGVIIVYNPQNVFGSILKHFKLMDDRGRATELARDNNIIIVNTMEKLHDSMSQTKSWQKSVTQSANSTAVGKNI